MDGRPRRVGGRPEALLRVCCGCAHIGAGLTVGMSSLVAIGIVGDAGVRPRMRSSRDFACAAACARDCRSRLLAPVPSSSTRRSAPADALTHGREPFVAWCGRRFGSAGGSRSERPEPRVGVGESWWTMSRSPLCTLAGAMLLTCIHVRPRPGADVVSSSSGSRLPRSREQEKGSVRWIAASIASRRIPRHMLKTDQLDCVCGDSPRR